MTTRWFLGLALAAVCAGCAHPPWHTDPAKDNAETPSAVKPVSDTAAKPPPSAPIPVGTWVKNYDDGNRIQLDLTEAHICVRVQQKNPAGIESEICFEGDCASAENGLLKGTITRTEINKEHLSIPVSSNPTFEMRFTRTGPQLTVLSFQGNFGDTAPGLCGHYYQGKL